MFQKDEWKPFHELVELNKARLVARSIRASLKIKTRIYRITMEKVKQ